MAILEWRDFLRDWNEELLRSQRVQEQLPAQVISSGWLGFSGASREQIEEAERRLHVALPPTYRAFLSASNGWLWTADRAGPLWSADKIEWFGTRHVKLLRNWPEAAHAIDLAHPSVPDHEYLVYGEEQDSETVRFEYLPGTLEISDLTRGDSHAFLLNPAVVTSEGEWEAWDFASWYPGAYRYRSFQDLMLELRRSFHQSVE